jgi:hypothetical protein
MPGARTYWQTSLLDSVAHSIPHWLGSERLTHSVETFGEGDWAALVLSASAFAHFAAAGFSSAALASKLRPLSFLGMAESQTLCRLVRWVRWPSKATGMSFPPRLRSSACRGWWMSPMKCRMNLRASLRVLKVVSRSRMMEVCLCLWSALCDDPGGHGAKHTWLERADTTQPCVCLQSRAKSRLQFSGGLSFASIRSQI